ncbi:MAG: SusC/RagA family TonB-linked outer membrane protein [Flavobacteriales bacterium]|nr:SusC/RagA family TonB-linked outer membrane protein [Flavobacteriales bacterium]
MKSKLYSILLTCLCLVFGQSVLAQSRAISGKVTDGTNKEPLPGVTIQVPSTNVGTISNADGSYNITVPEGSTTLRFSYLGYKTVDLPIGTSNTINLGMEEDVMGLDMVVVTALAIKKEVKSLGYSTENVGGDALSSSGEANVIQGLAAKSAGIQVVGSGGTPGTSSKILIRGNSSFTRTNEPLIVVDGVPIDNSQGNINSSLASDYPFNAGLGGVNSGNRALDLNPDDIESVTILKGPAAAALYGARAGNGAIIYTTKGAKGGKLRAMYTSSVEISQVNKMIELQDKYASGGSPASGPGTDADVADYGPDGVWFTDDDVSLGTPYSWGPELTGAAIDNVGNFFQNGISTNNNLSMTGGSNNNSFRFSIGRNNTSGVIPNSEYNRTSLRLSAESKISDNFTVNSSANYVKSGGTRVQNGSNLAGVMLALMRAPRDFDLMGKGETGYLTSAGYPRNAFYAYDNPFYSVNHNTNLENTDRVIGNVGMNYAPLPWLDITYRLGADVYSNRRQQRFGIHSWQPDPGPVGEMEEYTSNFSQIYSDLLIGLKKKFNADLEGHITLGNNLWHTSTKDIYSRGRSMNVPDFYNLSNFTELYTNNAEEITRTAALFFDGGLEYKNWLYVNASGRNEWSSTFGANKNNFFYPAVNTSIIFTELVKIPNLSFGKLRLGYAESGISPPAYSSHTYYERQSYTDGFTGGLGYPYLGQNGFSLSDAIGNPDLRPERQKGMEFGLDLRFFTGRLNLDLTYYNQKSVDILMLQPISASTGFTNIYTNAGEMVNKGWEITLGGTPVKAKDFTWDINLTFTKNTNEVLKLAEGVDEINIETAFSSIGSYAIVGDPYGALYGTQWKRAADGQLLINPNTGLPIIDGQRGNIGNPFPDWLMNIRNSFKYKQFRLSALLDIRQGGDIWAGTYARLTRHGATAITEDRNEKMIIEGVLADANGESTGQANNIEISKWQYYVNYLGDFGASESSVYDGSWVRLRELTLSYDFKLKSSVPVIRSLNVYATGRNLWLSTNYPGIDPETSLTGSGSNVNGFDYFNNPGTKSYIFGVKVGF